MTIDRLGGPPGGTAWGDRPGGPPGGTAREDRPGGLPGGTTCNFSNYEN